MYLSNFIFALCLIGAIQCARVKREDEIPEKEVDVKTETPEVEISATEAPEEETGGKYPIPDPQELWASLGKVFSSSGNTDAIKLPAWISIPNFG